MGKIKRRKVDTSIERRIATGFIISTSFIQEIHSAYKSDLIETKMVKLVIEWALDYYHEYEKAPGPDIEDIFNSKVRNGQIDEDTTELVSDFLQEISEEYERSEQFNVDYLKDETLSRFKARSLKNLKEDIEESLARGDVKEAESFVAKYTRIEMTGQTYVDPYTDKNVIQRSMEDTVKPLFEIPFEYGNFLRKQIQRGRLVGVMGREKIGKSFILTDFGHMAVKGGCNVAYFDVGDMGEQESVQRIHSRLLGRGTESRDSVLSPVLDCYSNQINSCTHDHRTCSVGLNKPDDDEEDMNPLEKFYFNKGNAAYRPCSTCLKTRRFKRDFKGAVWYEKMNMDNPLKWRESLSAGEDFTKRSRSCMRLATRYNGTTNVGDIRSSLDMWKNFDDWIADVIIIDYADILAPEDARQEKREQENERWKALRRLSQERHALVISASQTNSKAFSKGAGATLDMSNFSEDHRKLAHANCWIGLNQTDTEKKCHILRVNYIVARNQQYTVSETVKLLTCLEIGRPHVASYK